MRASSMDEDVPVQVLKLEDGKPRLVSNAASPTLTPGEVMIRPLRMAIAAADLRRCQQPDGFTGVLGHEFVGRVEQVATKAEQDWLGQRVVGAIDCVCNACDLCRRGLREHCRQRTVLGLRDRNGCFAERFTLPAQNLHAVPDHLDDDRAVFAHTVAAAMQIVRQLHIEGKPYITVLGDGPLGLICAQVLSQLNATVRCIGRYAPKIALCEKWSVKHRLLDDIGLRQDQDIVVDCTDSPTGIDAAAQMVRPRGTIVLKSLNLPDSKHPIDLTPVVTHELNLMGSRSGPLDVALDQLASDRVDVLSLVSRRMRLSDGVDALRTAGRSETLRILLEL